MASSSSSSISSFFLTSSSSGSTSSCLFRQRKYDVFLSSGSGETPHDFTNCLYYSLRRNKIKTFMDEKIFDRRKDPEAFLRAIEESTISIIVFAEEFVVSTRWLDEIAKIMDCMKMLGQRVLSVFLGLDDPYILIKEDGSFAIAISKHEDEANREKNQEMMEKIPKWKEAVGVALSQCGWNSGVTRPDSKLVGEIVKYVVNTIRKMSIYCPPKHLVGVNSQIQKVNSLLHIGLGDIRIIGLWGMGGIGKTIIAKELYSQICKVFEAYYFVENVSTKRKKCGIDHLLKELYSRILDEDSRSFDLENHSVKTRLRHKKVLIVLDNVQDSLDLEELLLKGHDSFGIGSRIIVTSRDFEVIKDAVDETYNVEKLNYNDSLQLFCLYAFNQNQPPEMTFEQSKAALDYCENNPLALKILGSALYGKGEKEWESALIGLKKDVCPHFHNVLRACYNILDVEEKKIFLDIACFFRGWDKDYVIEILESCYSSAYLGINVLIEKSLITILDNDFEIHDLLQEMCWNIVLQELKPEKRSRLWDSEDIYNVLRYKKGTQAIEGIFLETFGTMDTLVDSDAFVGMDHLKFLKVCGQDNLLDVSLSPQAKNQKMSSHSRCQLSFLSNELRYLYWSGFPFKSLPRKYNAENLVMLILPNSMIKQLWTGVQNLPKLKRINLEHSRFLTEIPNLSKAENIAYINLARCESLVQIPSSIEHLRKLEHLNLYGCTKLKTLPKRIDSKFLKFFDLSYCPNVEKCPDVFGYLEELYLPGTSIKKLPQSIFKLQLLRVLKLANCSKLTKLPELTPGVEELNFSNTAIRELPQSFYELKLLRVLNLTSCSNLTKLPKLPTGIMELNLSESAIKELPQSIHELKLLRVLNLTGCSNFTKLPELLPSSIEELHLSGTSIEELPLSIQSLTRLVDLKIEDCKKLTKLPVTITRLKSLKTLCFKNCPKLESFPEILQPMECLIDLNLHSCKNFVTLPSSISRLKTLRTLQFFRCEKFEGLPEISEPMEGLILLRFSNCNSIENLPNSLHYLKYLEKLHLEEVAIIELPSSVEQLHFLKHLILEKCENLGTLPIGIRKLFNCMEIVIKGCPKLQSLPQFPPYLKKLEAFNCESLTTLSNVGSRSLVDISFQQCFRLDQKARSFITSNVRQQMQFMAVKLPHHRRPIQRIFPGSEIPEWLNNQSNGSSLTIKLPSKCQEFKGIAFCFVLALKDPSPISTNECWVERIICKCHAKVSKQGTNEFIFRWATSFGLRVVRLDQVVLCYEPCIEAFSGGSIREESWMSNCTNKDIVLEFFPVDSSGQCIVKKCAVLLVEYDAEFWECMQNFYPMMDP